MEKKTAQGKGRKENTQLLSGKKRIFLKRR